jgi:type I restriction enzyme, S subunit
MSNKQKAPVAPKLRFPEFRSECEWEMHALSSVATVVMGSSPKSEFYNEDHDGLPLLQGNADIKNRLSAPRIFTSEITKECHVNDILMSVRAPVGSVAKAIHHACIGRGIASIHSKKPNSQEFLYQWLLSYESSWASISQGGTFDAINSDDLKGVVLPTPLPTEQQKIADCLSSLDELIAAQARKVNVLKTHKKGLMQQLFPCKGETQPRLRFPEFRDTATWNEVAAGKIFSNRVERGNSRLPIYSVTMTDGMVPRASLERRIDDIAETSANKTVRKGDIAYNMMRMWQGALGVAPEDCMVSPAYIVLKPKVANTIYFSYFFKLSQMLQVLTAHSRGLTEDRLRLYYDDFAKVPLLCPSVEEQNRIADFLSSLDGLIAVQTQELDALKTHKKGLMQQLFPAAEAVET